MSTTKANAKVCLLSFSKIQLDLLMLLREQIFNSSMLIHFRSKEKVLLRLGLQVNIKPSLRVGHFSVVYDSKGQRVEKPRRRIFYSVTISFCFIGIPKQHQRQKYISRTLDWSIRYSEGRGLHLGWVWQNNHLQQLWLQSKHRHLGLHQSETLLLLFSLLAS